MCTKNGSYCENEKKREKVRGGGRVGGGGGGRLGQGLGVRLGGGGGGGGVRVDANGEVKLL